MQSNQIRNIYEAAARDTFLEVFIKNLEKNVIKLQEEDEKLFDDIKKEIIALSGSIEQKLDAIRKEGVTIRVNADSNLFSMGLISNILESELAPICNCYIFNDYIFTKEDITFIENYLSENRNANVERQMLSPAEKKYNDWKFLNNHIDKEIEKWLSEIVYLRSLPIILVGLDNEESLKKCEAHLERINKKIEIGKELEKNKDKFNSFSYCQLEKIFEYYMFVKSNWDKYISIRKLLKKLEEDYIKRIESRHSRALNLRCDKGPVYISEFQLATEKFYKIYHEMSLSEKKSDNFQQIYGNVQYRINPTLTIWLNEFIGLKLMAKVATDTEDLLAISEENKEYLNSVLDKENKECLKSVFNETRDLYIEICRDEQLCKFFRLFSIYYKKLEEEDLLLPKDVDREINSIYCDSIRKEKLLNEKYINVNYNSGIPPANYSSEIEDDRLKPLYNLLEFNGLAIKEQDINYIKNKLKSDDDETKLRNLTTSFRDEEQRVWDEIEPISFLLLEEDRLGRKINRLEKKSNKKIIFNVRKKHLENRKQKLLLKKENVDGQLNCIRKCNSKTEMFNSFSHKQLKLILDYYETVEKYQTELHGSDSSNTLEARWNEYIDNLRKLTETRWERAFQKMSDEVEAIDSDLIEKMRLRILKICFMKNMNYLEENDKNEVIQINPESISWFNQYMRDNLGLAKIRKKKGK